MIFLSSIDHLHFPEEPKNPIKDVPNPISARTELPVSYPMTEEAKILNVTRCKEVVEKRLTKNMICSRRFLKAPVVSFQFVLVVRKLTDKCRGITQTFLQLILLCYIFAIVST